MEDKVKNITSNTQVLIFAGGLAKRMGAINKPKALLKVNGKPLIDICLNYFLINGFNDFVLLLGKGHKTILKYLEKSYSFKYSIDPPLSAVGKGKALVHAINNKIIDLNKRAIIAFPDDVFTDSTLPLRLLMHHLEGVRLKEIKATAVFASGIEYPYGVAKVDSEGFVTEFKEKPIINIFTSVGLYVLEPYAFKLLIKLVDMSSNKPVEFENILLPRLAKEKKLYSMIIPRGIWFPINTLKELEKANSLMHSSEIY